MRINFSEDTCICLINLYRIYSPYLGPLLQTRSQKGSIATLAGNKERDPTKRLLSRSTATTVVKRLDDYVYSKLLCTWISFGNLSSLSLFFFFLFCYNAATMILLSICAFAIH